MYAVIETGGKQIKVAKGDSIFVEKLDVKEGDTVMLREEANVSYISVCRECHYTYYNELSDVEDLIKYDNIW